ncbi:protein FAM83H [Hippocampus zosterae]|uniref:protein FAM83H n=1 Tax=Hippocampus zosterae TaxID=109293 RepID=UPI00223DCB38|nr:protein FAM83H [Hippocampus zosterae]XP_051926532.1 protein FAM83H [Hippocampus zosterae]XP_051926533.1 protein FAM83H [Hippocampus zosterae]XP_051926535.1 protein FAM83H [Hippocampus zosterae]
MAHRSQSSSIGDNPLDPNYLPPHYKEEYRLAIDALIENDLPGYHEFLQSADVVSFLAQTEIEHIKSTIQEPTHGHSIPDLRYPEAGQNVEGSSDTYWPMQSDLAAPGLDLGWPMTQNSFIGPTEVTTLVNPSEPSMPSIKEQARRLIKNARQVIAVVMDTFTDVDIFADLLDATARHIPVYILLDEQEAHNFVSMVINCKVNLDLIQMMRVRTVAGITYQSRTGKSFKGQMKDRFLLADCRAVLSGNYSFMWSYEKIHRCIAHLFLGELVATFDEEFRILYAQSEPLIIDPSDGALTVPDGGGYFSRQLGLKRTQSLLNPLGFRRQAEITSSFPHGDQERNLALPFRRNDPFRHTIEHGTGIMIGKYSQQHFRSQQSYLEQGRSIMSRQMELSSFKRHSYAEGTQDNYMTSRHYMKHRVMNNLDETDFHREPRHNFYSEGPGPGSGQGHYDRHRPPHLAIDQYSDTSSFRSDLEFSTGNYPRGYAHLSSEDLTGPDGIHAPPVAGRYGGNSAQKRPTIGQAYACQSSPTNAHPPDKKSFPKYSEQEHGQDASVRHGLRNWRIHSYLSTYEEEAGLNQPAGPDAFDDPSPAQEPGESSTSRFGQNDPTNVASKSRVDIQKPRYGKPINLDGSSKDLATKDLLSSVSMDRSEKELEKEWGYAKDDSRDKEFKEPPELFLSKHDSFRSRVNPLLQRSSRLRSSLIFSSSKAEIHSGSAGVKSGTEDDGKSSIVAQILEKRRSLSREPFEWKKIADEQSNEDEKKNEDAKENEKGLTDIAEGKAEYQKPPQDAESNPTIETSDTVTSSSLNINDPASRLMYFKEVAAKRKASKIETEASLKLLEPAEKKSDYSDTNSPTNTSVSSLKSSGESETKKPDSSAKVMELTRRSSLTSSKPSLLSPKPFVSSVKPPEAHKDENSSDGQKKDIFKTLKPLQSPKIFKRDPLKLKGLNPRRVSCGEEILTDATDSEKSELKKSRSHSSSTALHDDSKDKVMGSNTSVNTIGDGKGDGKTLDFLKKQTQRLKGLLGPKDKEKKSSGEDRGNMSTVKEMVEDYNKKQSKDTGTAAVDQTATNHKTSAGMSVSSRYQPSGSSVLFSSNLRDDTKVILEQISANSQKNRHERDEDGDRDAKDNDFAAKKNRLLRPHVVVQEREGLLKRIESLRKEKKVYSRFEMGNTLG